MVIGDFEVRFTEVLKKAFNWFLKVRKGGLKKEESVTLSALGGGEGGGAAVGGHNP